MVSNKPTNPGARCDCVTTFSLLLRPSFLINLDFLSFFFSFDGMMRPLLRINRSKRRIKKGQGAEGNKHKQSRHQTGKPSLKNKYATQTR